MFCYVSSASITNNKKILIGCSVKSGPDVITLLLYCTWMGVLNL
jgi:hypothetical protein